MACEGRCVVDQKPGKASETAAGWIMAFYPDISVRFEAGHASLSSAKRDEGALRLIWVASLVNEELLSRGAAQRAELLNELAR